MIQRLIYTIAMQDIMIKLYNKGPQYGQYTKMTQQGNDVTI